MGKALLSDPQNNIRKGQELGTGITQKVYKGKTVQGYESSIGSSQAIKLDKGRIFFSTDYDEALDAREKMERKYALAKGAPAETLTWDKFSKEPGFEEFLEKEIKTNKNFQKILKKEKLTINSPKEKIFNTIKKYNSYSNSIDPKIPASLKILPKNAFGNLIKKYDSFKRDFGTISYKELASKIDGVSESKIRDFINDSKKKLPSEGAQTTRKGGQLTSRIRRGIQFVNALKDSGIDIVRTGDKEFLRFKATDNQIENLKQNFNFQPKGGSNVPLLEKFSQASKKTTEYKTRKYGTDLSNIIALNRNLNNKLKFISNNYTEFKDLRKFIKNNPKLLNLVEASFDPIKGEMTKVSLNKIPDEALRGRVQMQIDHIRGRGTVNYDKATKKILDGLDIEYPKNLYIVPQSINNSTKRLVENWVANNPNETNKIKKIENWFKKRDLSFYDTNKKIIRGAEPAETSTDIIRLGLDVEKVLNDPIIDKTTGQTVIEDGPKLLKSINKRNLFLTNFVEKVKSVRGGCRAVVTGALGGPIDTCEAIIKADPKAAAVKLNNAITATKGPLKDLKEDSQKLINVFEVKEKPTELTNLPETNLRWNNDVGAFETTNGDIASQSDIKKYAADNPMEVKVGEEPLKAATNKSVLANVGKAMARVGAPLPTAVLDSYFIGQQVKEGKGTAEIASNPLNWLGLATMEPLSKVAGIAEGGAFNKALRLGLNPATIRGITRFAGLPGLAISTAMTAYDQYQKYKDGEGFIFNLLNQKGTE